MSQRSRRSFLRITGAAVAPISLVSGRVRGDSHGRSGWHVVDSPTSRTLHDVGRAASGAFAVGAGGVVLERGSDRWTVAVESGPTGNGNNLRGVATTDDDRRVWFAGASGALGEYDPATDELTARSGPDGVTNTFTDLAVTGSAGDASVSVCDASGQVHVSNANGREGTWSHRTPGSGAAMSAIEFAGPTSGVVVDQNQDAFRTTDGTTWAEIELPDVSATLHDVEVAETGTLVFAGTGGAVLAGTGERGWERESVGGQPLHDVEIGECGCVHAVGASGTVVHRRGHRTPGLKTLSKWFDWWRQLSPTGQNLTAVSLGSPHVAVGDAGTIVEREMNS